MLVQRPKSTDKPSKFQYIKWLLTCGMTSYQQNSNNLEESQAFKDEDEMDELAAVAQDAGMVEVPLTDTPTHSAPVPRVNDGENELFSLTMTTKSKPDEN